MTNPIIPVTHDDVELTVAKALAAALKRSCTNARGECYAVTDESIAYDGDMVAEVDGEISLLALAEAAIAALPTIGWEPGDLEYVEHLRLMAAMERKTLDAGEWVSSNASAMRVVELLDKYGLPALPKVMEKRDG